MKFVVDAQLPRRVAHEIRALGCDALHTLDMPAQNRTTDGEIVRFSRLESRVVVTKDSDFVDAFLLRGEPEKLLFITTGNIANNELVLLLRTNWTQIELMLTEGAFVELSRSTLTLHM